jgi:predicted permease
MLARDFAFAFRTLRKSPAFALTAVLTVALGIGASTAIFSVMNAVLLKPLPYASPERLAIIWGNLRARHLPNFPFSPGDFDDVRRGTTAFQEIAAVNTFRTVATGENAASEQIHSAGVTPNFFQLMGARVVLGRDFVESDGAPAPAAPPAAPGPAANAPPPPGPPIMAILSHEFWQHRYGGDASIIGRNIETGFGKVQVVGVLAPGFQLLFPPKANLERLPDIWQANRIDFQNSGRMDVFLRVVGRLKPGAAFREAQGQLDSIAADLRRRFPIKNTAGMAIELEPMQANLVADVRPAIVALMGAVSFLLLIACANVANLLLVRAAGRGRELAVRAALGGGRWDLIRQMLAETLVLAGSGAVLGLVLAKAGIGLLISLAPRNLPRMDAVEIDLSVLGFTALAAVGAAAVFGIVPALRASRPDIIDVLRSGGRTAGLGTGSWVRNLVVTMEVALSFVLLIGSGLMVRSFVALTQVKPGFDANGVLTFFVALPGGPGGPAARAARIHQIRDKLRALPGVTAVTAASPLPLDGGIIFGRYGPDEAMADGSKFLTGNFHIVLPGYFEAMGTPVLEGRTFTEEDNVPNLKRVIVDRLLAAKMWPRQSPIGKRLLARVNTPEPQFYEVIGVVEHQRHEGLATDGREAMFYADGYFGHGGINRWAVRTQGNPTALIPEIRSELAKIDPRLAAGDILPMSEWVDRAQAQTRFSLVLIAIFAGIAVVLAAVGLYGVLSSAVRQRTAEIGLRMALGAAPGSVFGLVVGQGLKLSAIGIGVGIIAAFSLTQIMGTMLIGVKPHDPATFGAIAVLFFAITVVACALPARRAAGLDPTSALREE